MSKFQICPEECESSTISSKYGMYGVALKVAKSIDEEIYNDIKINNELFLL